MKKLMIVLLAAGCLSDNSNVYSEQDCNKDALKALQKSGLSSVFLKANESVEGKSDTTKGMILGIQDTTDMTIQNALKAYCKLQDQAKNY